jgi:hypothetical protein
MSKEEEAWEIYYGELRRRAGRADEQMFGRDDAIVEAAHEAYRATADRLSAEAGWDDDRVLVVTHAFGQTVKEWVADGAKDWDGLRDRLQERWRAWQI